MDEETRARSRELARQEVADAPELSEDQQHRLRAIVRGRVSRPIATAPTSSREQSEDA